MTELTMALTAWLENDVLALRYSVTNHSDRDVYLLNRVPDLARQTKPDVAYVELRKEERLVDVSKDIPKISPGMAPILPQSPHVTPLRGHKTFVEAIHIAVPVREYRAYIGRRPDGPETHYEQLKLTIGYYWAVPGMTESTKRSASGLDILIPMPPPGTKLEFGHLVGNAKLSIPVREPSSELEPTHLESSANGRQHAIVLRFPTSEFSPTRRVQPRNQPPRCVTMGTRVMMPCVKPF